MSHDAPGPRPRQVTVAGWVIAVTSAVLVVSVFDTMSTLHSVDTRDRLTGALTTGSLKDLGIGVDHALSLMRGALFVAAVGAVVTGVLGVFVLQRHATARIVLTLAAIPVVVTAPVAGGFLGVLIGGATVLLWTQEARDWFAGRAPTRPSPPVPVAPAPVVTAPRSAAAWPPPTYPPTVAPRPAEMPSALRVACVLTWIFSGLTGGVYALLVLAIAVDRTGILATARDYAAVRDRSLSDSELVGLLLGVAAAVIVWCILAAVFAALAWRRHPTGWMLLVISVGVASFVELLAVPFSLLNLAACLTTFALLLRPSVRAWVRHDGPAAPASGSVGWPPPAEAPRNPPADPPDKQGEKPTRKPPVW